MSSKHHNNSMAATGLSQITQNSKCLRGVVGYHVCFTRTRSPVRTWTKTLNRFWLTLRHEKSNCFCLSSVDKQKRHKNLHGPGIEPGSAAWQAAIIPLNQPCLLTSLFFWKLCWKIKALCRGQHQGFSCLDWQQIKSGKLRHCTTSPVSSVGRAWDS